MPTYVYRCKTCGEQFEMVRPFSAKPLRRHVDCGGEVQKVFHLGGIFFKGPGFYSNDSRSKAKSTMASSSDQKAGAANSKPASSIDSKGAPSTDRKASSSDRKGEKADSKAAPSSDSSSDSTGRE